MQATLDIRVALRELGLRVTRPRVAVFDAVRRVPHADTDAIIATARRQIPEISHQAVYDTLHTLTDIGILRRIQPAGSAARYEVRVGDNHHHIVCRRCGAVEDVDCVVGEAPCLTPSDDHGYSVDTAEVVFWGLCPICAADPRDESSPIHPATQKDNRERHLH